VTGELHPIVSSCVCRAFLVKPVSSQVCIVQNIIESTIFAYEEELMSNDFVNKEHFENCYKRYENGDSAFNLALEFMKTIKDTNSHHIWITKSYYLIYLETAKRMNDEQKKQGAGKYVLEELREEYERVFDIKMHKIGEPIPLAETEKSFAEAMSKKNEEHIGNKYMYEEASICQELIVQNEPERQLYYPNEIIKSATVELSKLEKYNLKRKEDIAHLSNELKNVQKKIFESDILELAQANAYLVSAEENKLYTDLCARFHESFICMGVPKELIDNATINEQNFISDITNAELGSIVHDYYKERGCLYNKLDTIRMILSKANSSASQIGLQSARVLKEFYEMKWEIPDLDLKSLLVVFRLMDESIIPNLLDDKLKDILNIAKQAFRYAFATVGISEVAPIKGDAFNPLLHSHADSQMIGYDFVITETKSVGYMRKNRILLKTSVVVEPN